MTDNDGLVIKKNIPKMSLRSIPDLEVVTGFFASFPPDEGTVVPEIVVGSYRVGEKIRIRLLAFTEGKFWSIHTRRKVKAPDRYAPVELVWEAMK